MTVRIRIPSSDDHETVLADPPRPSPRPPALIIAALLALSVPVALVVSVVSGADTPTSSVPAPFETTVEERTSPVPTSAEAWSEQTLPGEGEILAMGMVGDAPVAVVTDWIDVHVWRQIDGVWQLDGSPDVELESAVVMDDRVLLVGVLEARPTVWEWVDGSARYLFQPTSGFVAGAWSVGGRLVVSVAPTVPGVEQAIRFGRRDALWMESTDGEFEELNLVNIESVFAVSGDAGSVVVGGRDADGRAAVGFVRNGWVLPNPVPVAPLLSAVTDLAGDEASPVVIVSVANRRRGTHQEVRAAGRDWGLVTRGDDLVGIEVIDDVVVGVTQDGAVVKHRLDGEALPSPSSPPWSYGFTRGLALLGKEPVAFGSSEHRSPMFTGPSAGSTEVMLPSGQWERYHSEASDGFRLVHVGSLEFATRDGELFHRAWNADRWHPAESDGALVILDTPQVVELEWGFVLVPAAGTGVWTSDDGEAWELVGGSDIIRIHELATDGEVLVGFTHLGALGGPMSDVTLLDSDHNVTRFSLPYHAVGPVWEEGVGFAATIASPESSYTTSPDGIEWTRHDGTDTSEWVVAFDGALYLGSGQPVVAREPPAETPGGEGWLYSYGEVPAWRSASGSTWIRAREEWIEVGLGVEEGLPGRPNSLVIRGSNVFALVDGMDGIAETYVLELD